RGRWPRRRHPRPLTRLVGNLSDPLASFPAMHIATRTLVFVAGQDDQRGAMTVEPVPQTREPDEFGYTVTDLHALPDDGPRYELIDGSLIVSPSATSSHNMIVRWIANILEDANPNDDYFVSTDQSAEIDDHNEPRPDIVV